MHAATHACTHYHSKEINESFNVFRKEKKHWFYKQSFFWVTFIFKIHVVCSVYKITVKLFDGKILPFLSHLKLRFRKNLLCCECSNLDCFETKNDVTNFLQFCLQYIIDLKMCLSRWINRCHVFFLWKSEVSVNSISAPPHPPSSTV